MMTLPDLDALEQIAVRVRLRYMRAKLALASAERTEQRLRHELTVAEDAVAIARTLPAAPEVQP